MRANGRSAEADEYSLLVEISAGLSHSHAAVIKKQLTEKCVKYEAEGLISKEKQKSVSLTMQAERHQEWARRYDPIRLAIEHAALRSDVLNREGTDPKSACNLDSAIRKSATSTRGIPGIVRLIAIVLLCNWQLWALTK